MSEQPKPTGEPAPPAPSAKPVIAPVTPPPPSFAIAGPPTGALGSSAGLMPWPTSRYKASTLLVRGTARAD